MERVYFIAADEVDWDYAPSGRDQMMGMAFDETARVFVERGHDRIGKVYRKAVYREYTDAKFTTLKTRSKEWEHLGLLGPLIRAEVGDTIKVVFKNNAGRSYSIHPHGVFYDKNSDGSAANDGAPASAREDDAVPPGKVFTYRWKVPERSGPGPNDPSSVVWLYHSHVDSIKDSNAGLVGAIIVTARGRARPDGTPKDVDREFVSLFSVMDENASWYLDENIRRFARTKAVDAEDEGFAESNLMHGINGYVYGNLPGLVMDECQRVRWYLLALGTEVDLHTPHWHGHTGLIAGQRTDVVELLPASMKVLDMRMDNPGTWMYHCHVNDHVSAGMTALYTVRDAKSRSCGS
jgi:FtsP/CotA-like multicopper oxidase with cupredoxin domain